MAIDPSAVGRRVAAHDATLSRERLLAFARAVGETRPVYLDVEAARAAGWRDIPAPPTFPFSLQLLDVDEPLKYLKDLGVDLGSILHAEQAFSYHGSLCAGDAVRLETEIVEVYDKKEGALTFIVDETTARDADGVLVAVSRRTCVVRNR